MPLYEKKLTIWSESDKRRIFLHLDNCKVHNSKAALQKTNELGFKRPDHPSYSPDIAPSDFYLFGYVKEKLKGCFFTEKEELEDKIVEIITKISYEKRKQFFEAWIKRCEWVATHDGAYYP